MAKKKASAKTRRQPKDSSKKRLTGKEAKFIARYTHHWNGARAVREAGYESKEPRAYAYELLTKPHILKRIEVVRQKVDLLHEDLGRKATDFIQRQLDADPRAMFDDKGDPLPIHQLGDAEATLLRGTEHELETVVVNGQSVTRMKLAKVRIADQRAAAESAHKFLNHWREKGERRGHGSQLPEARPELNPDSPGAETDIVIIARRVAFTLAMGKAKMTRAETIAIDPKKPPTTPK